MTGPVIDNAAASIVIYGRDEYNRVALAELFASAGYPAEQTDSPDDATAFAASRSASLILLRGKATETAILGICERVRAIGGTAILVIGDSADLIDELVVLEAGADGLLAVDTDRRLLLARSRTLVRRSLEGRGPAKVLSAWRLDPLQRRLHLPSGADVSLTGQMAELMGVFVNNPGEVLAPETVAERLGKPLSAIDQVRVLLARLRRRLAAVGEPEAIRNVRGRGYVFDGVADRTRTQA